MADYMRTTGRPNPIRISDHPTHHLPPGQIETGECRRLFPSNHYDARHCFTALRTHCRNVSLEIRVRRSLGIRLQHSELPLLCSLASRHGTDKLRLLILVRVLRCRLLGERYQRQPRSETSYLDFLHCVLCRCCDHYFSPCSHVRTFS